MADSYGLHSFDCIQRRAFLDLSNEDKRRSSVPSTWHVEPSVDWRIRRTASQTKARMQVNANSWASLDGESASFVFPSECGAECKLVRRRTCLLLPPPSVTVSTPRTHPSKTYPGTSPFRSSSPLLWLVAVEILFTTESLPVGLAPSTRKYCLLLGLQQTCQRRVQLVPMQQVRKALADSRWRMRRLLWQRSKWRQEQWTSWSSRTAVGSRSGGPVKYLLYHCVDRSVILSVGWWVSRWTLSQVVWCCNIAGSRRVMLNILLIELMKLMVKNSVKSPLVSIAFPVTK